MTPQVAPSRRYDNRHDKLSGLQPKQNPSLWAEAPGVRGEYAIRRLPSPGTLLSSLTHRRAFQRSAQLLPVRLLRHLAQTIANKVRHFSFSRGSSIHLSARCDGTVFKHDTINLCTPNAGMLPCLIERSARFETVNTAQTPLSPSAYRDDHRLRHPPRGRPGLG